MKNSKNKKSDAVKAGVKKLDEATLKNVKGGFTKIYHPKGVSTKPNA